MIIFLSGNIEIHPLYIPVIASYVSQFVRGVICLVAYYKYVDHLITDGIAEIDVSTTIIIRLPPCTLHNYVYLYLTEFQSQNPFRFNCQSVEVIAFSL